MLSSLISRIKTYASRHEALILNYHSVVSNEFPYCFPYHMPSKYFREQIDFISSNFNCISLKDLVADIKKGKPLNKTVTVTFDDGYYNNYSNALPILEEFNVPATIFMASGFTDKQTLIWPDLVALLLIHTNNKFLTVNNQEHSLETPSKVVNAYQELTKSFKSYTQEQIDNTVMGLLQELDLEEELHQSHYYDELRILDWSETTELNKSDLITIGSHTVNHKRLSRITHDEAKHEIIESKAILENHIGNIDFFAYPFGLKGGDFSGTHIEMVKNTGYEAALTAETRTVTNKTNLFEIPRVNITSSISIAKLNYLLNGGCAFPKGFSLSALSKGLFTGTAS